MFVWSSGAWHFPKITFLQGVSLEPCKSFWLFLEISTFPGAELELEVCAFCQDASLPVLNGPFGSESCRLSAREMALESSALLSLGSV